MSQLTLQFFVQALMGQTSDEAHPVEEVVIDSRDAKPGAIFAALPGENTDGHDYVADAIKGGCMAALVERDPGLPVEIVDLRKDATWRSLPLPEPPMLLLVNDVLHALQKTARLWTHRWLDRPNHRIVGITGSVGKTTTKDLTAEVLATRFRTLSSEKSYNNEIGLPLSVLRLTDQHRRAVLEMSMYVPGEIKLLVGIAPPQIGVVTLIAPVHAERAGSIEDIVNAKSELVEALPPAPEGTAILNLDDERVMSMAERTQAEVITYGLNPQADLWADQIEGLGLDGIRFWIHGGRRFGGQSYAVKLPMLGRHSVQTALRAAAVGLVEDLHWEEVIRGLQESERQLRLIAIQGPNGSVVLDDTYNASPPSTLAALNLLNDLIDGRRIAVLGDMLELGSYEEQGHRDVGIRASAVADILVTVGELGQIIADEARRRRMPARQVQSFDTADKAAAYLLDTIEDGDTVLVKGSRAVGMEQIVAQLSEAAPANKGAGAKSR
jgi:UDP-N-acetylmuramoyl-tripeptide--D-alanyl-D-alanine ligase